jgi:hypothetical protein
MSDETLLRDLFDRWERVWHEGQYDLILDCVGETYIRHDQKGDRTVTRAEYAAEIERVHKDRPGIRVVVYDHAFKGDRAWFRFAFKWNDPTGQGRFANAVCTMRPTIAGDLFPVSVALPRPAGESKVL